MGYPGFYLGLSLLGKMVRGKCTLGRGLGPSPQENVSVPLSKDIHLSALLAGKSFLYAFILIAIGRHFGVGGGSLSV